MLFALTKGKSILILALREALTVDGFQLPEDTEADSKIPKELEALPNREMMRTDLAGLLKSYHPIALLFIDLDNFKSVNDTLGHAEGDQCLIRAVAVISSAILFKGKLYRWGGDEFTVVLRNFDIREAATLAERIRAMIDAANPGGTVKVTASIGVVSSKSTGVTDTLSLEKRGDEMMYISKKTKKNAVTCAGF